MTGTKIWDFLTNDYVYSSPTLFNGIVYVGSYDDYVYALSASSGELIWKFRTGGWIDSSPAVSNGIVYIGSQDCKLYALNAETGVEIWEYQTIKDIGNSGISSPAIFNGIVYIGSTDKKIYALNAETGVKIWEFETNGAIYSSPGISNGIVYIGSGDKKIYALNAETGVKIWEFETNGGISSSPAISNGIVYIGSTDKKIYALNAETGVKIWEFTTWGALISSPIISNGVAYIGSHDNNIYAIGANLLQIPLTNFTANITSGTAPLTVKFTDSSTNSPTSWSWTFGDGETSIIQNPSHTYINPGTYSVSLTATNAAGSDTETKTRYINVTSPDTGNDLPLHPGWNFISVPKTLEDGYNTPIWLDQYVDPEAHSMWGFNGETASWVQMTAEDPIIPLDGYWLWNGEETTVPLTFKDMGQQLPPTKNLFSGWNAIGFTATVPATARDTLLSVQDTWVSAIGFDGLNQRYENGIINGGSGEFADTRDMYPGHGYWLYMDDNGILSPLSG